MDDSDLDPHYVPTDGTSDSDSDEPPAQRIRMEMPPPPIIIPSSSQADSNTVIPAASQSDPSRNKLTPIQQRNKDSRFFYLFFYSSPLPPFPHFKAHLFFRASTA